MTFLTSKWQPTLDEPKSTVSRSLVLLETIVEESDESDKSIGEGKWVVSEELCETGAEGFWKSGVAVTGET